MQTYLLVDFNNLAHRCKHVCRGDIDTKAGMALHITFNSLRKSWRQFNGTHVVFCLDSSSWRKLIYAPYKAHRAVQHELRSPREIEDDTVFFEIMNDFVDFVKERTNVTILSCKGLEADDVIAGWVDAHPNDNHVILSGDSDFFQLIAPNVKMYDGVKNHTITLEGHFEDNGKDVIDKKTKAPKKPIEPQWELFKKIMRGDASDGVFSAYPRVRETQLRAAFDDREGKGYAWNNLMLQTWEDHEEKEHRVLDDYYRNKELIDLRAQPEEIKGLMETTIQQAIQQPFKPQVGIWLLRFCDDYQLNRIGQQPESYASLLQAPYPKENENSD